MNKSQYDVFQIYKKDRNTAKLEIKELELLLDQAKKQYKHVFNLK